MKFIAILTLLSFAVIAGFSQTNYTFTGKGLWTDASNWHNNNIPPTVLPSGSTIYIYTATNGDTCVLNVNQTISIGAKLQVENAVLLISSGATLTTDGTINLNVKKADSILICTHKWMTKNLDVATYRNGDPIPYVSNPVEWSNLTTGAWCYYNNDPANGAVYGKLYNWYAVNDPRGLAPAGWHIPTWQEWDALATCLGGASTQGGLMKETGTVHWLAPNTGASNLSGFTALPGGWRGVGGGFSSIRMQGYWWSATNFTPNSFPLGIMVEYSSEVAGGGSNVETHGFSVRCVKD